ncbi:MAG: tetratricopeptide repeat protein [Paracoccaceae bacterium]|nr:tetratricopeptide repeat protein [Paracoccaceae bacterium]MDG1369942.1 tetratricopeptide repeat protein [Paracoccaceae bacterium]
MPDFLDEIFKLIVAHPAEASALTAVAAIGLTLLLMFTNAASGIVRLFRRKETPAIDNLSTTLALQAQTIADLQAELREKKQNRQEAISAGSAPAIAKAELAQIERMEADPQAAYDERREDLAEIATDLAQIDNLPPEKLEQAQAALSAGRTATAETLLAEVERDASGEIERAAQAAYLRGEIAEEDIRWADAAAHYTRAANLAPTYDRLKKAREFIWRAGDAAGAVASGEALIATAIAEFEDGSEEHATALNEHALTLRTMGRYEEAELLYRQAIEIDKATIGEAHPDYAMRLHNLAALLEAMGRYEEAEPLYRQAIEIGKVTMGEAHPDHAQHLNNLGVFLVGRGRFDEVPDLCRDAVRISRASLGDDHPDTKTRAGNFAGYLREHDATSTDLADLIAAFGDDIGR